MYSLTFTPQQFFLDGVSYPTVENAFQASKTLKPEERRPFEICTPVEAKRRGKKISLRSDWEIVKYEIMRDLLYQKFAPGTKARALLDASAGCLLVEGNRWHDNEWGACSCPRCKDKTHQNRLGHILMQIRDGDDLTYLKKVLFSSNPGERLINEMSLICNIVPELKPCVGFDQCSPWHCYDVYEHTAVVVNYCNYYNADMNTRIAALFHDIAKPQCAVVDENGRMHFHGHGPLSAKIAVPIFDRLKVEESAEILQLIQFHDLRITETLDFLTDLLHKFGKLQFQRLLILRRADVMAQADYRRQPRIEKIDRLQDFLDSYIEC